MPSDYYNYFARPSSLASRFCPHSPTSVSWRFFGENIPIGRAPDIKIPVRDGLPIAQSIRSPDDMVVDRTPFITYAVWSDNNRILATNGNGKFYELMVTSNISTRSATELIEALHNMLQSETIVEPNQVPGRLDFPAESRQQYETIRFRNMLRDWVPVATPSQEICRQYRRRIPSEKRHRNFIIPVPFVSFRKSAVCMADKDLKLTRVAILRCLEGIQHGSSHTNVSAIDAWRNYEQALIRYGIQIALECKRRGFSDKSLEKLRNLLTDDAWEKPSWIYWKRCRESYQSYLKLKDYQRYAWKLLARFWKLDRYIRRSYSSLHHFLRREWGYDPYNLSAADIGIIMHNVAEICQAKRVLFQTHNSHYVWSVEPQNDILYVN